ncbi:sulfite exporter TauE/SafE family protein [Sediminispirochaeta smaragdinae]|uniref:Probable membrane transporter protein n=1 Tax=Sediminispirochaeta smaragdinae (strain DSM 11293 / JCM 15392 / SEBR 4228) TaxID=573413 RepID=E1RBZ8_SEDSS|nr:sulfite exporter TauE/SafE family protein [Sediminispirochaeta smaragdinae]ADK79878.1 protein of unknown function DUF81 [Sediminispirochaeta smaragdinae DSM 11293]
MNSTVELYIFVFLIEFVCYFIKGLAGFGDPLISTPLLSMTMDNSVISPLNLCLATPVNAYMSWQNRKAFSIRTSLFIILCILCGIIPGTMLLKYASSWLLKAFLGILVIGIGIEMITRDRTKTMHPNKVILGIVSFCSGITAGLYGINLFFVAYIERTSKNRQAFRGNICFVFLIENIFRIVTYIVSGLLTKSVMMLVLAALPGMASGFTLGSVIDKKLSEQAIRRVIIAIFMAGGFSIFIKALIFRA